MRTCSLYSLDALLLENCRAGVEILAKKKSTKFDGTRTVVAVDDKRLNAAHRIGKMPDFALKTVRAALFTARQNRLPEYKGRGRMPEYGEIVRPLARIRKGKTIAADKPSKTEKWSHQGRKLRAHRFCGLTLKTDRPGGHSFDCVVIFDPKYKQPLVLATNLSVSAFVVWQLYRDRWAVEQLPLAAKVMLGGGRAYVHGGESRFRLPELALLAGNVLSYVAAGSQPVSSGFWDRAARPTCGRLRRVLFRQDFSLLPVCEGKMRKKNSITAHLKTGVDAHRRKKAQPTALFTGN